MKIHLENAKNNYTCVFSSYGLYEYVKFKKKKKVHVSKAHLYHFLLFFVLYE